MASVCVRSLTVRSPTAHVSSKKEYGNEEKEEGGLDFF